MDYQQPPLSLPLFLGISGPEQPFTLPNPSLTTEIIHFQIGLGSSSKPGATGDMPIYWQMPTELNPTQMEELEPPCVPRWGLQGWQVLLFPYIKYGC